MKSMNLALQATILFFFAPVIASLPVKGVDVTQNVTEIQWKCLKREGYTYNVVRLFMETGEIDPNAVSSLRNARSAGIPNLDGYIDPDTRKTRLEPAAISPRDQVKQTEENLRGITISRIWIRVENASKWSTNQRRNVRFIRDMIDEIIANDNIVGVHTNKEDWQLITNDTTDFANRLLWYTHHDNQMNYNDFEAFGGWLMSKVAMKQFAGLMDEEDDYVKLTVCGVEVGTNWQRYPVTWCSEGPPKDMIVSDQTTVCRARAAAVTTSKENQLAEFKACCNPCSYGHYVGLTFTCGIGNSGNCFKCQYEGYHKTQDWTIENWTCYCQSKHCVYQRDNSYDDTPICRS